MKLPGVSFIENTRKKNLEVKSRTRTRYSFSSSNLKLSNFKRYTAQPWKSVDWLLIMLCRVLFKVLVNLQKAWRLAPGVSLDTP